MELVERKSELRELVIHRVKNTYYPSVHSIEEYLEAFDNIIKYISSIEPDGISVNIMQEEFYFDVYKGGLQIYIVYFLDTHESAYDIYNKKAECLSSRFLSEEISDDKFTNFKIAFSEILEQIK